MTQKLNIHPPELWTRRVEDLGIRLEGSPVWPLIERLFAELDAAGVPLRPACYVSNEWGCPDGLPLIGIPFYLVDPRFHAIEEEYADDLEDDERILAGLRHEAGHAFTYAFRLYEDPEWQALFGDFGAPYGDDYLPRPFARAFVRHLPGWYAQKHADEDFAETFAVWLTPGGGWRERYAGTPALAKLEYVGRVVARLAGKAPLIDPATVVPDPDELAFTVGQFYADRAAEDSPPADELGQAIDSDLRELFPAAGIGTDAATLIWERRKVLMRAVSGYTGTRLFVGKVLVGAVIERARALGLRAAPGKEADSLIGLSALLCALAMNFCRTGHLIPAG